LEHLVSARIEPEAITLLCRSSEQPWLDDLPEDFLDVRVEIHDPKDRRRVAYLATTKEGRRVYLNRSVVDADQLIVFTSRGCDPQTGYTGGETTIFPALSDEETQKAFARPLRLQPPTADAAARREAAQVCWLLGLPLFVQVIEGSNQELSHVLAGTQESNAEGLRLWKERWRVRVDEPADVVVAGLGTVAGGDSFTAMAQALIRAASVVKAGGKIVLLTDAAPDLSAIVPLFQETGDADQMLKLLDKNVPPHRDALFLWAKAAAQARIYLLSEIAEEIAEELWTVPLQTAAQAQKLLDGDGNCIFLPDANKTLARVRPEKL
jgi:nickel-dependent lactate racemase